MTTPQPRQRSYAYFEETITLHSNEAQHVFERTGEIVDAALRNMRYGLRYAAGDRTMDSVVDTIEKELTVISELIAKEMAIVDKLIKDNGVTIPPVFRNPVTITVKISTPLAAFYYSVIQQVDKLIVGFEKLYLSRVWKDRQRATAGNEWSHNLFKISSGINDKERRAWEAANRRANAKRAKATQNAQEKAAAGKASGQPLPSHVPAPSADNRVTETRDLTYTGGVLDHAPSPTHTLLAPTAEHNNPEEAAGLGLGPDTTELTTSATLPTAETSTAAEFLAPAGKPPRKRKAATA